MAQKVIDLHHISKTYGGAKALDNVDFDLYRGEVLCLAGENGSGKSTLIKIIAGITLPDGGAHVKAEDVSVIWQDLSLFPNLSVAENICFPLYLRKGKSKGSDQGSPALNGGAARNKLAMEVLSQLHAQMEPDAAVGALPIAKRQLVAIARALVQGSRILIMDEPTASLSPAETEALFEIIGRLRARQVAVLFVTHKLDEILRIADRVTVIRDGRILDTRPAGSLSQQELSFLISGRKISFDQTGSQRQPSLMHSSVLLSAERLSRSPFYENISFSLHAGEVLGLAGPLGCGKGEVARTLFGLMPSASGRIRLAGEVMNFRSNVEAVRAGIAYVPEDRIGQGAAIAQSIRSNESALRLKSMRGRLGLLNHRRIDAFTKQWTQRLQIRSAMPALPVSALSGGNQQKVVLAKWLAISPKVLILVQPTNGVDVGAKQAIYEIVQELSSKGIGILLVSDEPQELFFNCDKVLVMSKGRVVREVLPSSGTLDIFLKALFQAEEEGCMV